MAARLVGHGLRASRRAVEQSLGQCEGPTLRRLRDLDRDLGRVWPLTVENRALLGQFIALHIVRTPAFGLYLRLVTEDAITDERGRGRVPPESFDAVAQMFRGPRMHANALLVPD